MPRRLSEALLLAVSIVVIACAYPNRGSDSAVDSGDRISPPTMRLREDRLNVRRNGGGLYGVTVEVPIDAYGQPMVDQIQFRGVLPASAQQDVVAWLVRGSFEPARKNGAPVPGVYILHL